MMSRFRYGHIFTYGLAGVGIVFLILLLIVPIPPFILDIMVGLNLAVAIIHLLLPKLEPMGSFGDAPRQTVPPQQFKGKIGL